MGRAKGKLRGKNVSKADAERMKLLRGNGLSYAAIALQVSRTPQTVRYWCSGVRLSKSPLHLLHQRIRAAVKKLRAMFPHRSAIGCRIVAKELGMDHSYIAKVMKNMTISGRFLVRESWAPDEAGSPAKGCHRQSCRGGDLHFFGVYCLLPYTMESIVR